MKIGIKKFSTASLLLLIFYAGLIGQVDVRDISAVGPVTENFKEDRYTTVYYISQRTGSDKDGNGNITKPWASISFALQNVTNSSEQNKTALLVAAGSYSGSTIKMKSFVDLYGGFNNETWSRNIYINKTILDGENIRRVVVGADSSRIDGFTITNGLSRSHGGGILCDDTSPIISNCFVTNNTALEPVDFNYNRIHQKGNDGGGIACRYNAVPVIRNNIFYANKTCAGNGAAISFYGMLRVKEAPKRVIVNNVMEGGWQPLVKNNVFIHNVSGVNDYKGTRSSNGGAISCAYEARPIIENNVIVCNRAEGRSDGGGIYSEDFSYPVINGNWILGNICDDDGGGIYTNHLGQMVLTKNFIAGNWTKGNGAGGIRISKEGRAAIIDNIIVHNQTGGGVHSVDGYIELKHNIIMNNKGKASVRYSNNFSYFGTSLITNNIIRDNDGSIMVAPAFEGQVRIINNNISKSEYTGENYDKAVRFEYDEESLTIKNIKFDLRNFQTVIKINESLNKYPLTGRVIRIGEFWSVIKRVDNDTIYAWGKYDWRPADFKEIIILSDYIKKER